MTEWINEYALSAFRRHGDPLVYHHTKPGSTNNAALCHNSVELDEVTITKTLPKGALYCKKCQAKELNWRNN